VAYFPSEFFDYGFQSVVWFMFTPANLLGIGLLVRIAQMMKLIVAEASPKRMKSC
jgi:hypothetical protein